MNIDNDLVKEALQRWARTPDGVTFYLGLQKVLMGVPSINDPGALQENLGRRRFASELMAVMAEGMIDAKANDDPRTRPIIFKLDTGRSVVSGPRGARRRVSDTDTGSDTNPNS